METISIIFIKKINPKQQQTTFKTLINKTLQMNTFKSTIKKFCRDLKNCNTLLIF
mgnify:CR=1 FL=1